MPSTITVTTALRDACIELLSDLGRRAEEHALEVEYHVVSAWVSALLGDEPSIGAAAVAAQHEFCAYPVNERWLTALDNLIIFGGEGVNEFMVTLSRYYLFDLPQVEEILWQQYSHLRRNVILETSRHPPETWGEWDGPMRAFFQIFQEHLRRQNPNFDLLLGTPTAHELADVKQVPAQIGVSEPLLALPSTVVDDTATLITYLEWCVQRYGRLEQEGMPSRERFSLRLDDVFVPRRLRYLDDWSEVRGYIRYQLLARRGGYVNGGGPNGTDGSQNTPPSLGPITQVLEDSIRLLVLGGPGEGKTTLLRHMAFQHASVILDEHIDSPPDQWSPSGNQRVPIYLHIADYAENASIYDETLLDYLLRAVGENDLHDPAVPGMLGRMLEAGRCVVLIDGLDAVLEEHIRRMAVARIRQFTEAWCADQDGNRILAASRPVGHETTFLKSDFEATALVPLNKDEIGEALMRWALASERAFRPMLSDESLQRTAEQTTIGILREVSLDDSLRQMASNPLMLRTMAERHLDGEYLSPRRVGLLRSTADAMIRSWRLPRGPSLQPQVQENEVTDLLSHLGYWLHDRRSSGHATEHEVADRLSAVWMERHPEANGDDAREAIADFMAKVRHQGGVLAEVRPRRYGFAYPSMEEYFAARYLVARYRLAAERIRQHLHDPRWDQVVRLAVGFVALDSPPDASDLLDSAILAWPNGVGERSYPPSPFENVLKRDLLFAGSLLGDSVESNANLTRTIVQQLVDLWLLGDRDHVGRFDNILDQARRLLCALDGKTAGQLAIEHALSYLEDDGPPVRASLADALTFWPSLGAQALPALVRLGRDESPVVRRAVGEALGRLGTLSPEAHVLLLRMVSDQDNSVRRVARRALSEIGSVPDTALNVWVELLHDEDPGKRSLGAKVLQRVGTLPALVIGEMLSLLSDEDERVRTTVANTLAKIDDLSEDALLAIAREIDGAQPDVKAAAITALARPVDLPDDVLAQVLRWSGDPDAEVRHAATQVLDTCKNTGEAIIDALMNRAGDDTLSVRQLAIEAMSRKGSGNPRVAHMLLHFATEANPGVKISTARAMGNLGELSPEAEGHLADLLIDFHAGVREAAMNAVAQLGRVYDSLLRPLIEIASREIDTDTLQAGRTLAAVDGLPGEALEALVRLLPSNVEGIGESIATSLHKHSPLPAEIVHALMDLAIGGESTVRSQAIEVLGRSLHAVPGVLELLLNLAEDTDVDVRAEAISSLRNARDVSERALDRLFEMLDGEPLAVRKAVAVTLAKLSQTLPHLNWDDRRMEAITDRLYHLLEELPPRASWEPDVSGQNEVFEALSWMAARYGPEI